MTRKTYLALLALSTALSIQPLLAADIAKTADPEKLIVSPPELNENGLAVRKAPQEGGANTTSGMGVETGIAPISGKSTGDASVEPLAVCTSWWVWGSHTWKYRYAFLYVKNEMSAKTETFYGTSTDPNACGKPALIADVLVIDGRTYGGWPNAIVKQTGYNTSIITKSDSATGFGGGLSPVCGAAATHTATKSGITWSAYTKSGCA